MRRLAAFSCVLLLAMPAQAGIRIGDAPAPPQCHDFRDGAGRMHSVCIGEADFFDDVCTAIATFAWAEELPQGFFARLVWQKARFDPVAGNSSGIAQFMPAGTGTRQQSFLPAEALAHSAEYVRQMRDKFGNLGLAAAAYLSGEEEIASWLGGGKVPAGASGFVEAVTERPLETWRADTTDLAVDVDAGLPLHETCVALARSSPAPVLTAVQGASWKPWGVLIAQHFSAKVAVSQFDRAAERFRGVLGDEVLLLLTVQNRNFGAKLRHSAMIGRDTREEAEALCNALRNAGGNCVVVHN